LHDLDFEWQEVKYFASSIDYQDVFCGVVYTTMQPQRIKMHTTRPLKAEGRTTDARPHDITLGYANLIDGGYQSRILNELTLSQRRRRKTVANKMQTMTAV
jgi:hypothetical protein